METAWKGLLPGEYGMHVSVILLSCPNKCALMRTPVHIPLLTAFCQMLLAECKDCETTARLPVALGPHFHGTPHLAEFLSASQSAASPRVLPECHFSVCQGASDILSSV